MTSPDWDPRDPAILRDQRAAYDRLRTSCPVAYSDFLGWSLFEHADVRAVLDDPDTFSSASRHLAIPNGIDPPQHTVYRAALEPFFDRDQMAAFAPRGRALAQDLAERSVIRRGLDFIHEFAEPFALRSGCLFLGWSENVWVDLQGWTHGNQQAALSRDREASQRLATELAQRVTEEIQLRRTRPGNDLMTRLMETQIEGKSFTDDELVSILRNWIAGHGTVAAGLGILVFELASDRKLQQRLRDDPGAIPAAVDEILRVDDPLVANRRTTTQAVEIGGRNIDEGAKLTLMWIAANRDERVFPASDAIHLHRDQRDNLVFGAGIHDCIGAPLARLELQLALEALLDRTRTIELDLARAPIRGVYPGNGFTSLPIQLVGK